MPYKKYRGKLAFRKVMCYNGIPNKFKDKKIVDLKSAHISKVPNLKYRTVKKVTVFIGDKSG